MSAHHLIDRRAASAHAPPNYSDRIDAFVARHEAGTWLRTEQSGPDATWTYLHYAHADVPRQGWKLHVSATVHNSDAVLGAVLDAVAQVPVTFKLAKDEIALQELNNGAGGLSQVGKFITIYPHCENALKRIAHLVDCNTRDLRGPDVPTDLAYREGSVVFFRYGDFTGQLLRLSTGELAPAITGPDGNLVRDIRETQFVKPDWAAIPFESAWRRPKLMVHDTVARRLVVTAPMSEAPRGNVYLAIDLQAERLCALKTANHNFEGRDSSIDARSQLVAEAEILKALAATRVAPEVYGVLEPAGETILEMEFIEGQSLSEFVTARYHSDAPLSRHEITSLGLSLAAVVADLHRDGIGHGDLKSANVMLTPERKVRLIDFGLSVALDAPSAGGAAGTRGYFKTRMPREPIARRDLYALGAVLFFIATGAEPSVAPDLDDLLVRPLQLLNPALNSDIAQIIERCLVADATGYAGVQDLLDALTDLDRLVAAGPAVRKPRGRPAICERLRRGSELLLRAMEHTPGFGAPQDIGTKLNPEPVYFDINRGLAGAVVALARIANYTGEASYREALQGAASRLAGIAGANHDLCPGLYNGKAGMAAALLLAARVLDCGTSRQTAHRLGRDVLASAEPNPDLFIGLAGIARAGIALHAVSGEQHLLRQLEQIGERLVDAATTDADGGIYWTIPAGYAQMSGHSYLGFAHGAAGIADVLLDLYRLTGRKSFAQTVLGAANWIARQALRSPSGGLCWPVVPGGPPHAAFWCHGAAGIGSFFARLAGWDLFPGAMDVAKGAADAVSRTSRRWGPSRCHGIAGSIEFMMEMFEQTRSRAYLDAAADMCALSETFYRRDADSGCWQPGRPGSFDLGYMTGLSGLLSTYVRNSMAGEFACTVRI